MEKYVTVIDEDGSFLEATYPRRARGLVKKGRARFVDEEETTICLIKQEDNCNLHNASIEETQPCLSDIYNYFIKLSEDTLMSDFNNINNNNDNNTNDDVEKKIDSEIDKLVNDAVNRAMGDNQTSDEEKTEIDTEELLKAIKAGLKESLEAANVLAKKGYASAKSGIKDMAGSVKDMFFSYDKDAEEEPEPEPEPEEFKDSGEDESKKGKVEFKFDHKNGKFQGKFGEKEFKFDAKDFKMNHPFFKGDFTPGAGHMMRGRGYNYAAAMDFITSRIDMVINNTSHLTEAVDATKNMPLSETPNGGMGDAERAKVIRATVDLREQTNRDIIALLNRMYDDVAAYSNAEKRNPKEAALDAHISKILEDDISPEEKIELINAISQIYGK